MIHTRVNIFWNIRFTFKSNRPGVGNLSLVMGPKQTLQCMAGRTNFPPTIPFPLLFMMLLKLGNLWNFNQIKFLIFTVHNRSRKYKA